MKDESNSEGVCVCGDSSSFVLNKRFECGETQAKAALLRAPLFNVRRASIFTHTSCWNNFSWPLR